MIVLLALALRLFLSRRLVEEARGGGLPMLKLMNEPAEDQAHGHAG